jgi:hypothetical protein
MVSEQNSLAVPFQLKDFVGEGRGGGNHGMDCRITSILAAMSVR